MTIDLWALLINNLPAIITAIGGVLVILNKVGILHRELNSRLTELVEATRASAHGAGRQEGIAAERARVRDAQSIADAASVAAAAAVAAVAAIVPLKEAPNAPSLER